MRYLLILSCLLLSGCYGGVDGNPDRLSAKKAVEEVTRTCAPNTTRYQASATNEAGVAWITVRCEVAP